MYRASKGSMELGHFCQSVPVFLEQLSRHQTTNCLNLAERLSVRSQEYMDILTDILEISWDRDAFTFKQRWRHPDFEATDQ